MKFVLLILIILFAGNISAQDAKTAWHNNMETCGSEFVVQDLEDAILKTAIVKTVQQTVRQLLNFEVSY
jgi:hypothetical protein